MLYKNYKIISSWQACGLTEFIEKSLEQKRQLLRRLKFTNNYSQHIWLNCISLPYEHSGKTNLMIIFQDISQQVQYERELARLNMEISSQNMEYLAQNEEITRINKLLKDKQKELTQKSDELALLVNNIDPQIWYLKSPEQYGAVNKSHADFLGFAVHELQQRLIRDMLIGEEADKYMEMNREVFTKKVTFQFERWLINHKNEPGRVEPKAYTENRP
ncbi:MAG: hypothetical protein HC896_14105 [Bacteroidales bacterium]|nr:hypothetical protein [Bacteroidales bacterium]